MNKQKDKAIALRTYFKSKPVSKIKIKNVNKPVYAGKQIKDKNIHASDLDSPYIPYERHYETLNIESIREILKDIKDFVDKSPDGCKTTMQSLRNVAFKACALSHVIKNVPSLKKLVETLFGEKGFQSIALNIIREPKPIEKLEKYEQMFSIKMEDYLVDQKTKKKLNMDKDLVNKIINTIKEWKNGLFEIEQSIESKNKQVQNYECSSNLQSSLNLLRLKLIKQVQEFLNLTHKYIASYPDSLFDLREEKHEYHKPGFRVIKNVKGEELKNLKIEKRMWKIKNMQPYFDVRDVKQGSMGDCWLEATLKSMTLKSPDKLLEIFPNYLKEVSPIDGSLLGSNITVRLYDYEKKSSYYNPLEAKDILVDATELTIRNSPSWNEGSVLWPHMIEKAMDKLLEKFHFNTEHERTLGKQIKGGYGSQASVMLLGISTMMNYNYNDYDRFTKATNDEKKKILEERLNQLKDALEKSDSPTCATRSDFGKKDGDKLEKRKELGEDPDHPGKIRTIWSRHAYTLKKIDEDIKDISKTKVYLINPWGEKYDRITGGNEITITLEEFVTYFDTIYTVSNLKDAASRYFDFKNTYLPILRAVSKIYETVAYVKNETDSLLEIIENSDEYNGYEKAIEHFNNIKYAIRGKIYQLIREKVNSVVGEGLENMKSYFIDFRYGFIKLLEGLGSPQHSYMKIFSLSKNIKNIIKGPIDQEHPFLFGFITRLEKWFDTHPENVTFYREKDMNRPFIDSYLKRNSHISWFEDENLTIPVKKVISKEIEEIKKKIGYEKLNECYLVSLKNKSKMWSESNLKSFLSDAKAIYFKEKK